MNFAFYGKGTASAGIYLSRIGNAMHTHHPQPKEGELAVKKKYLQRDTVAMIQNGERASIQTGAMRKLVLEENDSYVSKSTHRNILDCSSDNLRAIGESSASELMTWFRKQASHPEQKLSYKVLFYQGKTAASVFSNPKGRPSKNHPVPTPAQVAENMVVEDEFCVIPEDKTR